MPGNGRGYKRLGLRVSRLNVLSIPKLKRRVAPPVFRRKDDLRRTVRIGRRTVAVALSARA